MSHPMEGSNDAARAVNQRRWDRIRAMRAKLPTILITDFIAADAMVIWDVMEPSILDKASDQDQKLDAALDRLEAVFAARKQPAKEPAGARGRRT